MNINKKPLIALIVLVILLILVFVFNLKSIGRRPELYSVSKSIVSPGDIITLYGNYFGNEVSRGRVYIDGNMIYEDYIKSWDNKSIQLELNEDFRSGMLTVDNMFGVSEPFLITSSNDVPQILNNSVISGYPTIVSANYTGSSGTNVVIEGFGFGLKKSLNRVEVRTLDFDEELITDIDILDWSDNLISFNLPRLISNIVLTIDRNGRKSNEITIHNDNELSVFYVKSDKKNYTLIQKIDVDNIISLTNSSIELFIPVSDSSFNQNINGFSSGDALYFKDLDVFHYVFNNLETGSKSSFELETNIDVYTLDAKIKSDISTLVYDKNDTNYSEGFRKTANIEVTKEINGSATWIVKNIKNQLTQIESIASWVLKYIKIDSLGSDIPSESLKSKIATPFGLINLTVSMLRSVGIPSRVVSGIKIGETIENYRWIEFYFPNGGWIPLDLLEKSVNDQYSIGHLDNNKISFSKGETNISYEISNFNNDFYALQNTRDKFQGNVESYNAIWHNVDIK